MSKQKQQRSHFLRRVKERFGLYLKDNDIHNIIQMITTGNADFIEKQSNRVSIHQVEYQGTIMHVCYDRQRGELVTALFPEGNPL